MTKKALLVNPQRQKKRKRPRKEQMDRTPAQIEDMLLKKLIKYNVIFNTQKTF